MLKKNLLLAVFFIAVITPVILYAGLTFNNNQDIERISPDKISNSLDRSIVWLMENREKALEENNAMLWWMIKRSGEITNDHRLLKIYKEYKKKYIDSNPKSVWKILFSPYSYVSVEPESLSHFPDYNLYFIYGLTCNAELGKLDIVQRQKKTVFCSDTHPISPACVTHQLMGLRFRQDRSCGEKQLIIDQTKELQEIIVSQLTWDPRVVDVYIQRVLMLVDTGAKQRVKHQWLKNIIDEQSSNGGWGDFHSLLALPDARHIGFYSKGIKLGKPKDTLHATAQGILLMSLLSQPTL